MLLIFSWFMSLIIVLYYTFSLLSLLEHRAEIAKNWFTRPVFETTENKIKVLFLYVYIPQLAVVFNSHWFRNFYSFLHWCMILDPAALSRMVQNHRQHSYILCQGLWKRHFLLCTPFRIAPCQYFSCLVRVIADCVHIQTQNGDMQCKSAIPAL